MSDNTTLNPGTGGDTLRTDDLGTGVKVPASKLIIGDDGVDGGFVSSANPLPTQAASGSVAGLLVGGQPVNTANPMPITLANTSNLAIRSGSVTGLQVGGVDVSSANPVPTKHQSGSVTGLLIGGLNVSQANPVPTSGPEVGGQILSGSTFRTVQYKAGNYGSGSANQVIGPQGANTRIRVLSVYCLSPGASAVKFTSTGSIGSITDISGLSVLPANGGFVLPYNPHGWFQTNVNEGLNLDVNTAGGAVGITITWMLAGA